MKKQNETASQILELIGGEENINSLNHCVTRLRFVLKNSDSVDDEKLEAVEGVVTVMRSGG